MMQNQIDRAVAKATGENISIIRSLGFSIADPGDASFDPERPRHRRHRIRILNWDRLDAKREAYLPQRTRC